VRVKQEDIVLTEDIKKQLEALKDRPVDLTDPDAPEMSFEGEIEIGKYYRPVKKQITLRIDVDVLEWFKEQPGKYQTLINQALRDYTRKHS
jgi:uncharacterized protein (DUF4415 family)